MTRTLLAVWEAWFGDTVRRVEAEAAAHRASPAGRGADRKTIAVLLTVAVCLTVQNYTSSPEDVIPLARLVGADATAARLAGWSGDSLARLTWWAVVVSLTYTVGPVLLITVGFGERLSDYGLKLRGVFSGWRVYLVFVAVMVPLVAAVSASPGFQGTYPFLPVRAGDGMTGGLVRWELVYAVQFLALEFFFRGFLLHGTKHRFGVYAVFVMMVPYCMIHFQKPPAECAASIVAGVALGLMSLKTRSVWLGAALHVSVAWGMDFVCLVRRGLLGLSRAAVSRPSPRPCPGRRSRPRGTGRRRPPARSAGSARD